MSGDDADPVLVTEVLDHIVKQLMHGDHEAGDAATKRAYAEAVHAADALRAKYAARGYAVASTAPGSQRQLAPLDPDPSTVDADPHAVAAAGQKVYMEVQAGYDRAKFGGDPVGRRAYGDVLSRAYSLMMSWARYAEQHAPTSPPPELDARERRAVDEALRLAGALRIPADLDDLDDAGSDRWNAEVMEAAEELAFFADFDAALLNSAWDHMLRTHHQGDKTSVGAVATRVVGLAAILQAPGTRGRQAARAAEMFAVQILRARARHDHHAADASQRDARAQLLGFTESELRQALVEPVPSGVIRSPDPAASADLAADLIAEALACSTAVTLSHGESPT